MAQSKQSRRILWYQAFGFLVIITLSWMDELLSLSARFLGGAKYSNWHESAMETIVVLAVWFPLFVVTKRILARLYYLEGFLRICAWCRKIGRDNEWLLLEQYLSKGFEVRTSHGICPECAKQMKAGKSNGA
jgi:hypothetical protein